MDLDTLRSLVVPNTTKAILLSADGLGGFPHPDTGHSELETARIPRLDALARRGSCGLIRHVGPGITPGSGPGHLGLFGYEPLAYQVGRDPELAGEREWFVAAALAARDRVVDRWIGAAARFAGA